HRTTPFDGQILVPGSKSLTNRALVLAAVADSPSVLTRPLGSRDTALMASALTALGANVRRDGMEWTISPIGDGVTGDVDIDCGLAGTVMRFVPPLAALGSATVTFDGDERARERPMGTTISSLRELGVTIDDGGRGTLPFTVKGSGEVAGGALEIDASASSQFVSALLLAAPGFVDGLDLRHSGDAMPSQPHVDMTVSELRRRGIEVATAPGHWQVPHGSVEALDVVIEPDLSNAGPFIAAALVTGGRVTIKSWPAQTDQAGDRWRSIAESFGGSAERHGDDMVFTAGDRLLGVTLDLGDVGELTPVVAAVAALADGPSQLTGVAHLRGHETDRLAALTTEINRLGGNVTELDDGLLIEPRPLHGETFLTYDDHRMAHAGVVLGLRVPELFVENVVTTTKTYPNFAPVWERAMTAD
ncbi:MAG TPA: 3-phosphoshikimate 1-carboxyvinyltransferase, partial [Aeromicrobium sp.]|nr:3-phosphoshikimate 1-carboxyvinyltransferase [Aeromicrobium sp.]